jgi:hypothetical protein
MQRDGRCRESPRGVILGMLVELEWEVRVTMSLRGSTGSFVAHWDTLAAVVRMRPP